jgi:chemotaxis methyl-accepting protein methylase
MPELMARRAAQRRIRIWCAAAATGQEPYSLAMSLKEMGYRIADWRIEIMATDISRRCGRVTARNKKPRPISVERTRHAAMVHLWSTC